MTISILNLVPSSQVTNVQTTLYEVAALTTAVIDKATVTNTTALNATFSVNLVPSGGTAGDANLIIDTRTIGAGDTYECPELIGQVLDAEGAISTISGTTLALTLKISGREIT